MLFYNFGQVIIMILKGSHLNCHLVWPKIYGIWLIFLWSSGTEETYTCLVTTSPSWKLQLGAFLLERKNSNNIKHRVFLMAVHFSFKRSVFGIVSIYLKLWPGKGNTPPKIDQVFSQNFFLSIFSLIPFLSSFLLLFLTSSPAPFVWGENYSLRTKALNLSHLYLMHWDRDRFFRLPC